MSGERVESHSVTLQWCSRDQSKTTALSQVTVDNSTIRSCQSVPLNALKLNYLSKALILYMLLRLPAECDLFVSMQSKLGFCSELGQILVQKTQKYFKVSISLCTHDNQ